MNNSDDPFLVTSSLGITSVLRALKKNKAMVHMRLDRYPQAIITTVLDFDPEQQHIIVDAADDDAFNQRLNHANAIHFDGQVDKIRVQFSTGPASNQIFENRSALRLSYPGTLRRLQRRDHFRIDVPVSIPLYCEIPVKGKPALILPVKDISAGGIAMLDHHDAVTDAQGATLRQCQLELGDVGVVVSNLKIRRIGKQAINESAAARVIACEFDQLSAPGSIIIQNYIGRLERFLNARRRGLD